MSGRQEQPCESSATAVGLPGVHPGAADRSSSRCSTGCGRRFELHGFGSIETRAVEPLDRLAKQGEIDKEVYVVRRLHAADDGRAEDELGLHFDLTVPFARYVLENAHQLAAPVPPLPDPEGVARRAAAGGPLPRVHPGRHRHRRRRHVWPPTTTSSCRWSPSAHWSGCTSISASRRC